MNAPEYPADLPLLHQEAMEWIWRMASGSATQDDLEAMERWKAQSSDHGRALAQAARLRRMVSAQTAFAYTKPHFLERPAVTRRLSLGAVAAVALGCGAWRPPLGLWPSVAELSSDYRTGIGQQSRIALAQGISVQLNTETSISRVTRDGQAGIELVSGQLALKTELPGSGAFAIFAGGSRVLVSTADLDVRIADDGLHVACLAGHVRIDGDAGRVSLGPLQKVALSGLGAGKPAPVDARLETAWRQGRLLFHDAPLKSIVAEVNRYRPGRIVIANPSLAAQQYNAAFDIRNMEAVVGDLQRLSHSHVTQFPGGIVLLA